MSHKEILKKLVMAQKGSCVKPIVIKMIKLL